MAKTYAIADLHGRYDLLESALDAIARHASNQPGKIVTMGDYVDRGPQSRQIIERLMAGLTGSKWAGWRLVSLQGNHEAMMVETLKTPLNPDWWIGNGGGATLVSYGHAKRGPYDPSVVPDVHLEWMSSLPMIHVDKHRVFVHAGVDETIPLDEQTENTLTWRLYPKGYAGGYGDLHVVHGHEQFADGPKLFSGRTDLDTFAWYTGRLVVGVFDDAIAGGPVDFIEIVGEPSTRQFEDELAD